MSGGMMDSTAMAGHLTRYIEENMLGPGPRGIGVDDDLLASGVDSMGLTGLITFVEETFAVDIPPEDVTIESFGTIASIVRYLHERRATAG